jgi:hypothetical protein
MIIKIIKNKRSIENILLPFIICVVNVSTLKSLGHGYNKLSICQISFSTDV